MVLSQVFTVSQSEDASIIYLTDETGDYNVSSNPGGYGTPNPARADLANILVATYKASAGDESLSVDAYDPESVTEFEVSWNDLDGHFEFKVYPIDRKTGAETPSLNDFVYDFTANQLQKWNGSSWVSATAQDLIDNDVAHVTVDYPILARTWLAFNNVNKLYILGCSSESRSDLKTYIQDTSIMLNGTIALFAEGSYATAQKNIEKYASVVDKLIALS